jgi:hypothetical protein
MTNISQRLHPSSPLIQLIISSARTAQATLFLCCIAVVSQRWHYVFSYCVIDHRHGLCRSDHVCVFLYGPLPSDGRLSSIHNSCFQWICHKTNFVALNPRANYTDWATATCRRNLVPTFVDKGVSRGQRGGSPAFVNLSFLDQSRYFSFK